MSSKTVSKVEVLRKGRVHINKSRTVPEVFDIVASAETNDEKVALLKAYETKGLRFIVNGLYNVDWEGVQIPKFKINHRPPEICTQNINSAIGKLEAAYRFRHSKPEVSRRNLLLVLEEVSAPEAELLVNMMKGKKVEGISKAIFKKAFPAFFLDEA